MVLVGAAAAGMALANARDDDKGGGAAGKQSAPAAQQPAEQPKSAAPANADEPKAPSVGLKVGDRAPDAMMQSAEGKDVKLSEMLAKGPTVVVFYRGGWCPYCNTHLKQWAEQNAEIKKMGASLVAISPEKPESAKETGEKQALDFAVLSDVNMEAAKGFKLVFTLSEDTQKKYKGYGIDLPKRNAAKTWELPHPGTYVIDAKGMIRYAAADKDFAKRPDPAEAMKVLKEIALAGK
jgi:peroxiredoxin